MCRLIAFWVTEGSSDLMELVDALIDASRLDPYLKELYGSTSHSDGWGYSLYIHRDRGSFIHSKTLNPIYNTIEYTRLTGLTRLMRDAEYSMGFMHSRHASKGMPRGLLAVHPFLVVAKDGSLITVSHNGSIDSERLVNKLSDTTGYGSLYPDSYLIAKYLAEDPENIPSRIKSLEPYTRTALNLAVLRIYDVGDDSRGELFVYTYLSDKHASSKKYVDYYKMFLAIKNNLQAVVSSTIAEKLEETGWSIHDLSLKGDGFQVVYREGKFRASRIP